MHVNNEQVNTQRMLEHNRMKERVVQGSLQRSLVDVVSNNLDMRESTILNCKDYSPESTLKSLFSTSGKIESDADNQVIIKLKFLEKVDGNQIIFYPSEDGENHPRLIKLFVNRNELDFADIDSVPPTAQFELPFEYENDSFSVSLAGSRFTRMQSLLIFIEDNFGTDTTCLSRIRIEGFLSPTYHTEYK